MSPEDMGFGQDFPFSAGIATLPIRCRLIFLVLILFVFPASFLAGQTLLDEQTVAVKVWSAETVTFMRMQTLSGDWEISFAVRSLASAADPLAVEEHGLLLPQGEDVNFSSVGRTILSTFSDGRELDYLGDRRKREVITFRVDLTGGEFVQIEVPGTRSRVFRGSIHIELIDGELRIINQVTAREYLISIASEISPSSEFEANKAYLVMLRSLLHHPDTRQKHASDTFDFCDNAFHCFPFRGTGHDRELITLLEKDTAGEVLWHHGAPLRPRFQECCGGKISSALDVYGVAEPYHVEIEDRIPDKGAENCFHAPVFHWQREFSALEMSSFIAVGFAGGTEQIFPRWNLAAIASNGRVLSIHLQGLQDRMVSGNDFLLAAREFFGPNGLPGMRFIVEAVQEKPDVQPSSFIFRGMGRGSGVGLCLWGADGLARKGLSYQDILSFYFHGAGIGKTAETASYSVSLH